MLQLLRTLRIRTRLATAFGVLALAVTAAALLSFMSIERLAETSKKNLTEARAHRDLAQAWLAAVDKNLVRTEVVLRTIDPAEVQRLSLAMKATSAEIDKLQEQAVQELKPVGLESEVDAVLAARKTYVAARKAAQEQKTEGTLTAGVLEQTVIPAAAAYMAALKDVAEHASALSESTAAKDAARAQQLGQYLLIAGVILSLVTGLLAWLVTKSITGPLGQVQTVLGHLAQGDLRARAPQTGNDELTQLAQYLNHAMGTLAGTMQQVSAATDASDTGASELAAANAELASRTESQAATVEQTSAATRSLMQTVADNQQRTAQTQEMAQEAASRAEDAGQSMQQLVQAMQAIDQNSLAVGGLTTQISQIAFQTNILSLNASIEAAHAGEHGRGFAVVAQEVRALAARTADAAKQVDALVGQSLASTKEGSRLVARANTDVGSVAQSINQTRELTQAIAQEAAAQRATLTEIVSAVSQLDQVTQQNAAMVEEVSAAAAALAEQAQQLRTTVSTFKA